MSLKFDVKLTDKDMFRFNLYHTYTSAQGILSIVLGIFIIGVVVVSDDFTDVMQALPYLVMAGVFVFYIPISLWIRSKRQVQVSEVLSNTLHYELCDEGVVVTVDGLDDRAVLPWDYIYKAVTTKHNFLIFSNRVNAYIVPKEQVEAYLPQIYDEFEHRLKDYRLHIKR